MLRIGLGVFVFFSSSCTSMMAVDYGTAENPANYRGLNGHGVFPAHNLVTSCGENENVVWRTEMPSFGQSTPVYAAGRIFVTVDPYAGHDAPQVIALDAETGHVLWQAPVDNLDARSESEQKEARALRAAELAINREVRSYMFKFKNAGDESSRRALLAEAKEKGFVSFKKKEDEAKLNPTWTVKPSGHKKTDPNQRWKNYNTLKQKGWFRYEGWHYEDQLFTGQSMPSVVSDGTHVFAFTGQEAVACLAVEDGRNVWAYDMNTGFGYSSGQGPVMTASPALIGDILVVFAHATKGGCVVGLDKKTGDERWRQEFAEGGAYSPGSMPVHMNLNGTDVVYVTAGYVIRVGDGKVLGKVEHPESERSHGRYFGNHGCSAALGNRLMVLHGGNGGGSSKAKGGVYAFDLTLDGDQLTIAPAWDVRGGGQNNTSLIIHGGICYSGDLQCAIVVASGEVKSYKKMSLGKHTPIFADGKFWVMSEGQHLGRINFAKGERPKGSLSIIDHQSMRKVGGGTFVVPEVSGERLQRRIDRLGRAWWQWGRAGPTAYGNRVWIRSFDAVYCIGDPAVGFHGP